ncbi:MAG: conserved rane protein of unknown function [Nocardioidaceae bacterium]|nr:conserved rane protein of unknown function [Nocardioidaceae bacterium]
MLELVSLTPAEAKRRVRNYSLGMRQRLGIATALLGDPRVLILDEPANGLDPAGIRWMRDLLTGFASRGGTVLLSSHLLHEIEVIADDLVVIGNGKIVAAGTKEQLLAAAGTHARSTSPRDLAHALELAGIASTLAGDGSVRTDADPARVGVVALTAGIALTELRSAEGAGLEDMFLSLTADTQREGVAADSDVTYESFTRASGFPMSVILPMIAILAVTSEWSQRSGLTTFTLVPSRGRVIVAKAIATLLVGLGSVVVAFAVGALANVAGSALAGVDTVWDISLSMALQMMLFNLVGMAIGFTLGVVLRNSAAAIVGYFVISLVMPGILVLLAQVRSWFADLQPWIDWNETQVALLEGAMDSGEEWAMLGSTTMIWIVVPLVVGLLSLRRSEVK